MAEVACVTRSQVREITLLKDYSFEQMLASLFGIMKTKKFSSAHLHRKEEIRERNTLSKAIGTECKKALKETKKVPRKISLSIQSVLRRELRKSLNQDRAEIEDRVLFGKIIIVVHIRVVDMHLS